MLYIYSIVAAPGLDGNAFGAWKSRTSPSMWLRDFLHEQVENSRIMIYGYNADLTGPGAQSYTSILDLGKSFRDALMRARSQPDVREMPFAPSIQCMPEPSCNQSLGWQMRGLFLEVLR